MKCPEWEVGNGMLKMGGEEKLEEHGGCSWEGTMLASGGGNLEVGG